ncbi:cellulose binding domain-containing protein [Spirosoma oryzicola]|uniref:cellulose binding domain-containing protein n=1 Tax=Spirosoma oryzicola TaxID=2898794 RepID=UPI001E313365|nr:cellulose binding domain-containing protein [Spirosoma oryzicola]
MDKAGNLYVAEYYNNRVTRWAPGAMQGVMMAGDGSSGSGPGQLNGPTDVGMDATGNLFVLENGNNRVTRWAPGATQGITVAGGNGGGDGADQLTYPEGFYVDAAGYLYIADTGNARVQLWKPGATQGITVAGGNGVGNGVNQLSRPLDIWINLAGNLYVSDGFTNYRVQRFDNLAPSLTGLQAQPNPVCSGQPVSFTATVGRTTGPYSYTITNGIGSLLTGNASSTSFSQSLTATGSGPQSYTLTVTTPAGYSATASVSLTVIARPAAPGVSNLTYCQNAVASVLTASGSRLRWYDASGNPLPEAPRPATNQVGSNTYYVTQTSDSGCESERAALTVTVKPTPTTPTLVTQSGGAYPAGVSSLIISQNTGNVILTVSGCQGGSISWQGGNSTTLAVSTANTGSQSFTASCTQNGCTSPTATATVTVVAPTLKVLSRDPDNGQLGNNTIKPYLLLQNAGTTPIPYSTITLRYWLTTENNIPLIFQKNYVAIGQGNLSLRYVALATPRQGATGYIEYSFSGGTGSLAPNSDSGPLEVQATKQDYSRFVQSDDYSYINNSSFTLNARITAYQNGVIFYGTEPTGSGNAREAVPEAGSLLVVKVLGNPVVGSSAEVEISGASGQTVQLKLVDLQGKLINGHSIKEAGLVERVSLPLSNVQGMLLLEVSTATHRQQIKLLRP